MLNLFFGIGRLGKEPKLSYTPQGTPVCTFSLACENSYKSGDEWKKQTFWADCVFWGSRAEAISKNLSKGSLVFVEGRLQTRKWEKNGTTHYKTEIIGNDIKFIEKKKDNNAEAPPDSAYDDMNAGGDSELEPF